MAQVPIAILLVFISPAVFIDLLDSFCFVFHIHLLLSNVIGRFLVSVPVPQLDDKLLYFYAASTLVTYISSHVGSQRILRFRADVHALEKP